MAKGRVPGKRGGKGARKEKGRKKFAHSSFTRGRINEETS